MDHHVLPMQFTDVDLRTGVRLRYAEQGGSTGQPVIMLHGYTDSWFSFSRVLPKTLYQNIYNSPIPIPIISQKLL